MRKLTLDVEQLEVQSFDTAPRGARVDGTVQGHGMDADLGEAKTLPTNECRYSVCPTCQFQCSVPECYPPA